MTTTELKEVIDQIESNLLERIKIGVELGKIKNQEIAEAYASGYSSVLIQLRASLEKTISS